eukprot:GHVU01016910.1.p1 GENE.GHVU01016910.1~~GHVU01016910.1.p1  ORF type:complete len:164 (+),score=15.82 GHVU01016910.1:2476-2967(+)
MERDRAAISRIMRGGDAQHDVYGVDARWDREIANGYTAAPPIDGGEAKFNCQRYLREWFTELLDGVERMPEEMREYLLENGSIYQEIYVCFVELHRLPRNMFWEGAGYYARIVFRLWMLGRENYEPLLRLLNDLFHYQFPFDWLERCLLHETLVYWQNTEEDD